MDLPFLKELTEAPAVGTACGPVVGVLTRWFGAGWERTLVPDGFCLFQCAGAVPEDLEAVVVAHLDEIGGCVYGRRPHGGFDARVWGNTPALFASGTLQAYDWLAEDAGATFPVSAEVIAIGQEQRLVIHGGGIRPYRTAWTFREPTTIEGDVIEGKALDPRVTVYAAAEAVRSLDDRRVGALFVMAEECAMDVARKAVAFLQGRAPRLRLVVNADVPGLANLGEGRLDLPAIRCFEGRNFIDPTFAIRMADRLAAQGVEFHLSSARSGSQSILFAPLAPTISVALPSDGVHLPRVRMSLHGAVRCILLLEAIVRDALDGSGT